LGWDIDTFWKTVQKRYYGGSTESVLDDEEQMIKAHFAQSNDITLRRPIISRFILNDAANAAKNEAVEQVIKTSLTEKLALDCDLVSGAVTPHAFALEVNVRAAALLKRLGEVVGEDWYRKYAFPGAVLNFVSPLWMFDAEHYRRFAHLAPARPRP
jgi:hypothetical protein